jgi:hypothetical protein
LSKRKPAIVQIAQNVAANEIAGNDKENIDADETAVKATDLQMKQDHADNRNGTQSSNLGAKTMNCHKYQPADWRGPQVCSMV